MVVNLVMGWVLLILKMRLQRALFMSLYSRAKGRKSQYRF